MQVPCSHHAQTMQYAHTNHAIAESSNVSLFLDRFSNPEQSTVFTNSNEQKTNRMCKIYVKSNESPKRSNDETSKLPIMIQSVERGF
jgi:hypothetical protein